MNERGMSPGPGGNQLATKDDLREVQLDLREQITDGFRGVHNRQDVTNGRVGKAEVALGEHGARLRNVEREVFRRRRDDQNQNGDGADNAAVLAFSRRPVTVRDLKMFTTGVLVVIGVLLLFSKVLPATAAAIKSVLP